MEKKSIKHAASKWMLSVVDHNKGVKQDELYDFHIISTPWKYAIENLTRSHFSSRH